MDGFEKESAYWQGVVDAKLERICAMLDAVAEAQKEEAEKLESLQMSVVKMSTITKMISSAISLVISSIVAIVASTFKT